MSAREEPREPAASGPSAASGSTGEGGPSSEGARVISLRAAGAVAAGAARASGERERRRRRPTPLLAQAEAEAAAQRRRADDAPAGDDRPPVVEAAVDVPPRAALPDEQRRLALEAAAGSGEELAADLTAPPRPGSGLEERIAAVLALLRRRLTGEYEVDEYGFDRELTEQLLLAVVRPVYEKWFRVDVRGAERIPADGGALLVGNHSGTIAWDSVMTQVAVHDSTPGGRHLRLLGADLVFGAPVLGQLARASGATLATNADAEGLLSRGELVGVFPEGFKGIGKPFSERYKLQRFGRGGFVSAALRTRTPIVPVSIVGAEEIAPILGDMTTLARLLGVPYLPVTPTFPWLGPLGLVPLPSKWLIEFGAPVTTDDAPDGAADDPMLVFDLTDQVRETIQQTLYALLLQRRSAFF